MLNGEDQNYVLSRSNVDSRAGTPVADRCPSRHSYGCDRSAGRGSLFCGSNTAIRKSLIGDRNDPDADEMRPIFVIGNRTSTPSSGNVDE